MRHHISVAVVIGLSAVPAGASEAPASRAAQAQKRVADSEYEITMQGAAWQAPNRAQNFRTTFEKDGIRVAPRKPQATAWSWGLTLIGCESVESVSVRGNRITYDRGGIVEWYVNDAHGLEQGFTLNAPRGETRGEARIDLALTGTLDPRFSADGQAIDFAAPGGAIVVHYAQLRVADARGHVLPSRMAGFTQPGIRGIRLVVDDTDAVYPVSVDPLATLAAWTASSHQDTAWFGYSVATAGDVNGDGYSDVIVGAPLFDNGQSDEGRAFVYLGTPSGLAAAPSWTAEGDQANANFGWSVGTAGDVNGDGYSDVIVGTPFYDNGQFDEGRASLYMGSASGLATSAAWAAESNQGSASFGSSVATAGDVDGDGYSDVIVSAPEYGGSLGRVYIYRGSAAGLAATAAWTKDGTQDIEFGNAVATAGDVNGDGYGDVVIGAQNQDTDQINEGRAYVYLGGSGGLAATPVWTAEGDSNGAHFGSSVSTAGDVNGDGYADVIVGANGFTSGGQSAGGRVLIYFGTASGLSATAAWSIDGGANTRFGSSVATAGDINGDGYADIVVGAPQNGVAFGRVDLYLGAASGPALTSSWSSAMPAQAADKFGFSIATAGDVNGDGYSDVVVGAYQFNDGLSAAGGAFLYLGSAAAVASSPGWTADGGQQNAYLGSTIAAAGDVNGDGYSDVIVGAYGFDNGQTDEGRAFVYLGSASGLAVVPSWTAESNQAEAEFGSSLATAGDVNGDGYSDVIVGARRFQNGEIREGRASVYLGSASGLAATPAWTAESDQTFALFGTSVASAGDVNGDGFSDVIVGAQGYDGGTSEQGRAYVYLGSASGLAASSNWTAVGGQASAAFGRSVATAGDVNGDGYSDVIIGAEFHDNGQYQGGRAYVYLGSASGLAVTPSWTVDAGQDVAHLGSAVASAGDVNGDGYSDVIVGAYGFSNDLLNEGRAYVYLGSASGPAAVPAWTGEGDQQGAFFGFAVGSAGDVNGDGFSDVIVGAYAFANGQVYEGRAFVYLGSASGVGFTPAWTAESDQNSATFGMALAGAGDVNGDGYADVMVGAPSFSNAQNSEGRAYLYYGNNGDGLDRIPRQTQTNGAVPVALGGKSDSESEFRVRLRGRTAAGRGPIRLQWEVKPLGTPFGGTSMGASLAVVTGSPGASGSATNFNESIAGLSEGTFYHWRARTVSANPFFPRSPWISLPGNNITESKIRTSGCVDRDGDGYGETGDPSCLSLVPDCNIGDGSIWSPPGVTSNVRFISKTTLSWDVPALPGALASALVYDTLRSGLASNFLAGDCVESDDGPDTTASDVSLPSAGQAFFYLNRAQNACPAGVGSLGTTRAGAPRTGVACP